MREVGVRFVQERVLQGDDERRVVAILLDVRVQEGDRVLRTALQHEEEGALNRRLADELGRRVRVVDDLQKRLIRGLIISFAPLDNRRFKATIPDERRVRILFFATRVVRERLIEGSYLRFANAQIVVNVLIEIVRRILGEELYELSSRRRVVLFVEVRPGVVEERVAIFFDLGALGEDVVEVGSRRRNVARLLVSLQVRASEIKLPFVAVARRRVLLDEAFEFRDGEVVISGGIRVLPIREELVSRRRRQRRADHKKECRKKNTRQLVFSHFDASLMIVGWNITNR